MRIKKIFYILIILFLLPALPIVAQDLEHERAVASGVEGNLKEKIFYWMSVVEKDNGIRTAFQKNQTLINLRNSKRGEIEKALANGGDIENLASALAFNSEQISISKNALMEVFDTDGNFNQFIATKIRPAGAYILSHQLSNRNLMIEAWEKQVQGMDNIINAYLLGKNLLYRDSDSAVFDIKSHEYLDKIKNIIKKEIEKEEGLFFDFTLNSCLEILKLNKWYNAVRFEPLEKINQKAYDKIKTTNWKKYPYSSILVFGDAPDNLYQPISEGNMKKCREAVDRYKENNAPFIIVSGGYVHPFQTSFCEAIEMKKYIVNQLGVSDDAVIVEPYARHTTTNIRNTNRIISKAGIPEKMQVLGTSAKKHIEYIASKRFEERCKKELGYVPFKRLRKISDLQIEFFPSDLSLQINTLDPLDP